MYNTCTSVSVPSGASINQQDGDGLTALLTGVSSDFPLVVSQLLKASANPNLPSHSGATPLHLACRNINMGVVHMLLVAGADPKCWNDDGESPLSLAVSTGAVDIVQTLLHGCLHVDPQLYARSRNNANPLYDCLMKGEFFLARMLIMNGYRGVNEAQHFLSMDTQQWSNFRKKQMVSIALTKADEIESLQYIQASGCNCLPLQQLCRNSIRRHMVNNLCEKTQLLHLPNTLKDYVIYKDIYKPPRLSTGREINLYFDDNGRELS